jgi:hypothetical protein
LSVGRISFLSEVGNKEVVTTYVIRGKYTIQGCPAGPVKITVESLEPPDPEALKGTKNKANLLPMARGMKERMELPPEMKELSEGPKLKYVPIPLEYSNPETSGLTYEVQKGSQTHNIPLDKPK